MATDVLPKVTLWILESDSDDAEYFGKVDVGAASILESLRRALELNDILEWAINFWDAEEGHRMRRKLERLNEFTRQVHVIHVKDAK